MAALAAFLLPSDASAQGVRCDEPNKIRDALNSRFKEKPISMGITKGGGMAEVFRTYDPFGTWSIVVTNKENSRSCIVAVGEGWWQRAPEFQDPGS